jgi:hypothetical protein
MPWVIKRKADAALAPRDAGLGRGQDRSVQEAVTAMIDRGEVGT